MKAVLVLAGFLISSSAFANFDAEFNRIKPIIAQLKNVPESRIDDGTSIGYPSERQKLLLYVAKAYKLKGYPAFNANNAFAISGAEGVCQNWTYVTVTCLAAAVNDSRGGF